MFKGTGIIIPGIQCLHRMHRKGKLKTNTYAGNFIDTKVSENGFVLLGLAEHQAEVKDNPEAGDKPEEMEVEKTGTYIRKET